MLWPGCQEGCQGLLWRWEVLLRWQQEPLADPAGGGTNITVYWPNSASSILVGAKSRFLQIAEDYTFLNPHLTLDMDWFGEKSQTPASNPAWSKWLPSYPTSPHWYTAEHFERLIAAYLAHDADQGKDRTVREFVSEFRGLSGSAKQKAVLEETDLARVNLSELAKDNSLRLDLIGNLLQAMQKHTKPVKPAQLGVIGKEHLRERFQQLGCPPASFKYRKVAGDSDGVPWLAETAFGWLNRGKRRRLITGVNWSPEIVNPFRQLGGMGESLDAILEQQWAGDDEPVAVLLHLACPRVQYTDRGKSAVVISDDGPVSQAS